MVNKAEVTLTVNGRKRSATVEPRMLLVDFLRHELGMTGTHIGCEHGVCGACTVLVNGRAIRSCIMLAVQADGSEITTVEDLAEGSKLHPIQQAFMEEHGLQCGFCTPGLIVAAVGLLDQTPDPTEEEVKYAIEGNLCRCTGYSKVVDAILAAAGAARL